MEKKVQRSRRKFVYDGFKLTFAGALAFLGLSKVTSKLTSDPGDPSGNKTELLTTDGKLVQVDDSYITPVENPRNYNEKYNLREGIPNRKFVMVIDLARCKNALACQRVCNKHHHIAGDHAWLKVYKMQESEDTAPYWMPTTCMHCDHPACVTVCPVDATFKRRDGLVLIDNERCIGCRFCMAACPYSTRVFNWSEPDQGDISMNLHHEGHNSIEFTGMPSVVGTVDKCDFCPHTIKNNELPHCVTACPNGVFYFGDKYEDTVCNGSETVRLSDLIRDKHGYRLMESLGTKPSVFYLPPVDRLVDFKDGEKNYMNYISVEKEPKHDTE